jgi:hypothetical protein
MGGDFMDLFGFKARRKQRHENMMESIPNETDDFLKTGYYALAMDLSFGDRGEYSRIEQIAIYDELDKRGLVDELGFVR